MKICEVVEQDDGEDDGFANVIRYIEKNCGPYLKEVGGYANALFHNPMFRGVHQSPDSQDPVAILGVKQSRDPVDTPIDVQRLVDHWFVQKSGIAFRSSSVFCTGGMSTANQYGDPVVVLPVGEYRYCWSPVYTDQYEDIGRYVYNIDKEIGKDRSLTTLYLTQNKGPLLNFLKNGNYQFDHGLDEAIASHHEIMIACQSILIVNIDWIRENKYR